MTDHRGLVRNLARTRFPHTASFLLPSHRKRPLPPWSWPSVEQPEEKEEEEEREEQPKGKMPKHPKKAHAKEEKLEEEATQQQCTTKAEPEGSMGECKVEPKEENAELAEFIPETLEYEIIPDILEYEF